MGLLAEAYAQLASISAVLGGLAFVTAAAILNAAAATKDPNALERAAKVTTATAVTSAVFLIIAAVMWSLMAADLNRIAANPNETLARQIADMNWIPSYLFLAGGMFLFTSIGASGWIASRKLGFVTSAVALAGGIGLALLFFWTAT